MGQGGGDLDNASRIEGATDGTLVGNVADSMKVHQTNPASVTITPDDLSTLRVEDINASVGGVARGTSIGTSFTTLYSVTGAGNFFGFLLSLESAGIWFVRLIVDGIDTFNGSTGLLLSDIETLFDFKNTDALFQLGFGGLQNNVLRFEGRYGMPLKYDTSIVVSARVSTGSKDFKGGLAARTV